MATFDFEINESLSDIKIKGEFISDETIVLYLNGVIDTYNSNQISKEIYDFIEKYKNTLKHLVLHCEQLTYISSTGIGLLTEVFKKTQTNSIELYLMKVPDNVQDVLSLLGFSSLFNHIEDIGEITKIEKKVFPKVIVCPQCKKKLKIIKSGKFKCSNCKHIFRINSEGETVES